jgi:hypothetical protein
MKIKIDSETDGCRLLVDFAQHGMREIGHGVGAPALGGFINGKTRTG